MRAGAPPAMKKGRMEVDGPNATRSTFSLVPYAPEEESDLGTGRHHHLSLSKGLPGEKHVEETLE